MAPPFRSRTLNKSQARAEFSLGSNPRDSRRDWRPVLFSESTKQTSLAPNIRSLSWSPTGSAIATAISSHVRIWNPDRPSVKSSLEIKNAGTGGVGGSGNVEKVAFSPLRDELLATTGGDGGVRLWDVRLSTMAGTTAGAKSNKVGECTVGDPALFLTWHPEGNTMLVGRRDDVIKAIDIRKMQPIEELTWELNVTEKKFEKDRGQLNAMAFSNSGSEILVTSADGPVKILRWPDVTQQLHELEAHAASTYCVQHSPAGTHIAVGGGDSLITLWDTKYLYCLHTVASHASAVRDLSFSFDGAYLCAGSLGDAKDGERGLGIVHVDSGEELVRIETTNPVSCVAWHPSRYWIAYTGDPGGLKIVGAGSSI